MDSKFLEFYGNILLNAAKGQKQFEQFSKLMASSFKIPDFKGFERVEELFKQCYGFTGSPSPPALEDKKFKEMLSAFQTSFSSYAKQIGWVPLKDYEELKERVRALEEKKTEQQKVIDGFNRLLGLGDRLGYAEMLSQMQKITKKQNDQIKDYFQTFFRTFKPIDKPSKKQE